MTETITDEQVTDDVYKQEYIQELEDKLEREKIRRVELADADRVLQLQRQLDALKLSNDHSY